ncbi:MAG: hypothetical protein ABIK94_07115 [candidate division WOR-3 bacterium]
MKISLRATLFIFLIFITLTAPAQQSPIICTLRGSPPESIPSQFNGKIRAASFLYGTLCFLHGRYGYASFADRESIWINVMEELEDGFDLVIFEGDIEKAKEKVNEALATVKKEMGEGSPKDLYSILLQGATFLLTHPKEETSQKELIEILYKIADENGISRSIVDKFVAGEEPNIDERRWRWGHSCEVSHGHSGWHEVTVCFPDWLQRQH